MWPQDRLHPVSVLFNEGLGFSLFYFISGVRVVTDQRLIPLRQIYALYQSDRSQNTLHMKCGQAVCGKCSSKRSTIPLMGFEFELPLRSHTNSTASSPCVFQPSAHSHLPRQQAQHCLHALRAHHRKPAHLWPRQGHQGLQGDEFFAVFHWS
ncbi:hypothetical protein XENOCAPTIV_017892 [Xenoophorus captivus]|uniref:Uncharacterized protein n=1 Tax=Xenoophorus captivus TaxID=1517983 RepID=A0ABV0S8C4_9TELE